MSYVISFGEEEAFPLAREGFIKMCGFKSGSEKHAGMFAAAMKIREQGVSAINLRAILSEFDSDVIVENGILVGNVSLRCDSVFLIEKEKVRKVLFYIITADECSCESEQILDRVYADFWGTAYVDAAYRLFRDEVDSRYIKGAEPESVLSDAFGPGYYGMPTEELKPFMQIMDGEKIGIKCLPSCVMVPIKSCAGFFFVMEKGANAPGKPCRDCRGNSSGCRYCKMSSALI